MSFDGQRLLELLPDLYRRRDAQGAGGTTTHPNPGALREFLERVASQVAVLEEELEQLYENHFVETAAPWALPYLGELLGIPGLSDERGTALAPRAEVANTIRYRRRKGTAAVLEQLARDTSGLSASAVEFFQRLAQTQHLDHVRPERGAWASVRSARARELAGSPFDAQARSAEVRLVRSSSGRWNIPNVGIFLWRLAAQARTCSPLVRAAQVGEILGQGRHWRLSPLGIDAALCQLPETEEDIEQIALPENVPLLLTRRSLAGKPVLATAGLQFHPRAPLFGGAGASLCLWRRGLDGDLTPLSAAEIVVSDLHDVRDEALPEQPVTRWAHEDSPAASEHVLLDPERGRVLLPREEPLWATFHTLCAGELGGGEYARGVARVPDAVNVSQLDPEGGVETVEAGMTANRTVVEIADSGRYEERLPAVQVRAGERVLRARDGAAPVLVLKGPLEVEESKDGSIVLDGLAILGHGLAIRKKLDRLHLRDCTVMAGLVVNDGRIDEEEPRPVALAIEGADRVVLERCIVGPIRAGRHAEVELRDCIVDAGDLEAWALAGNEDGEPAGVLRIESCTIVGRIAARALELASNSIFLGQVVVEDLQKGCARFSWFAPDSRVPRRHQCLSSDVQEDVAPLFTSLRFGSAGFCQLRPATPASIRTGADDGAEMGVYHAQGLARREAHTRERLEQALPFGLEFGVFYES